jgi:ribosome-associated protein
MTHANPNESSDESESSEPLRLDHFLKMSGASETGGQAKLLIQNGEVKLNGQVETRRRKKLVAGDIVQVGNKKLLVSDFV